MAFGSQHALSANDRKHKFRAVLATVERRPVGNARRRSRYERNPASWLRYYLAAAYPLPWGKVHTDMVDAAVRAIRTGSGMAVAAPRGTGKSTVLWGVALWAILSGACRFPVVAGWAHSAARRMLRKWLSTLAENERIAADYPDAVAPFAVSVHSNRLKSLIWSDTGAACGADVRQMDGVLCLPDGLGVLGAVSISGNVRGLYASLPDGSTIRPDVLLLDDPQDKVTASSGPLVRKICERIEADLFSMSGPGTRLAVMAAVTVIADGDVAEHFLGHPDFESFRVQQITEWPTGFDDRESKTRKLWEAWNGERIEGLADHDDGKRAKAFYREHKSELTAGMTVSWPERYDRKRRDPDAKYAAMFDYYRLGEAAFMSERQNRPMKENTTVYDLTPAWICSRVHTGRQRGDIPAEARLIVASTDINHYGLHYAVTAFASDQTAWCAWYGRHDNGGKGIVPKDCPEQDAKRRMFEALVAHGQGMATMPLVRAGQAVRIGLWLIDSGYMPDVVRRYIEGPGRTLGVPIMAAHGYGFDKYRPTPKNCIGAPRENCHLAEGPVAGRFVAFQADAWRECSQRAWLGTPNAPGSISLFDGQRHSEIAEHICRERLLEKMQGQYGMVWRWATAPGWHDYGDALTMCYVGAAWFGIGTMGQPPATPRRNIRPRSTGFIEI